MNPARRASDAIIKIEIDRESLQAAIDVISRNSNTYTTWLRCLPGRDAYDLGRLMGAILVADQHGRFPAS